MIAGRSLWELVVRRADATPDAPFAIDEAERGLSFAEYRAAAERAAAGLHARGVGEGTAVSWVLPTRLDAMVLAAALARLGAVQNPILPIYREREVSFVTAQTRARLLCVPGTWRGFDYAEMARAIAAERGDLETLEVDGTLPEGDPAGLPAWEAPADDPVRWRFYTSGTTADPKGACHTDGTLLAAFTGMVDVLDLRPDDRHALVFPFTHIGGIGWLFAGLLAGFAHLVVEVFDPARTFPFLRRHGVTQAGAGTAFHQAYLAAQRARPDVPLFPAVRAFPGGGAPKPPALHADLRRELGGGGIVSGYGLTECPIVAMNRLGDPDPVLAETEGRPNPKDAEIRVVKPDGARAGPGEEGELRVRGPQLLKGYVDASLDADAFDEDGFFRTGDLGFLDAGGHVVITGRLKDVIIRKGENISAKEVEDLLYTHPAVDDVAVIGLPDPELGERCCAVVALAAGAELGLPDVVAFLKGRGLMMQKIPEQLEIVDAVPRNPAGKILKGELRARYAVRPD